MTDIIDPKEVQNLALKVIDFLAGEEDRFSHFLTATGLEPEVVQSVVVSPDLLRSVLEYTASDEALLMTLHKEQQIRPASVLVGCVYLALEDEDNPARDTLEFTQGQSDWSLFC